MYYRYSAEMNTSIRKFLKNYLKIFINYFVDYFEHSVETYSNPVFVVGCGHSGTTLLASVLSRHSKFFVVGYESECFLPVHSLNLTKKIIRAFDMIALQNGKSYFLEKTPKHVLCVERILKSIPKSRVIYMVRDGRDNVLSLKKRFLNLNMCITRWNIDNENFERLSNNDKVLIVRYENFVKNPCNSLKEICKFLEIEYEDAMLNSSGNPYANSKKSNMILRSSQVERPIYDNTGKWILGLDKRELDKFWKESEPLMSKMGYE